MASNIVILSSPESSLTSDNQPNCKVLKSPVYYTEKENVQNFCQILKLINCDGADKLEAIDYELAVIDQ